MNKKNEIRRQTKSLSLVPVFHLAIKNINIVLTNNKQTDKLLI